MGKLVVTEFISLDGVIEDPGGAEGSEHGGWSFRFPAPDAWPAVRRWQARCASTTSSTSTA